MNDAMKDVRRLIRMGFVDDARLTEFTGAPAVYAEELLDLYDSLDTAQRRLVVPILDPDYYARQVKVEGGDSLLFDFMARGIRAWRNPHPLIDLRFIKSLRNDLFHPVPTVRELLLILSENIVDPSPFFSLDDYRDALGDQAVKGSLLVHFLTKGQGQGWSPTRLFNPTFYRRQHGDVPPDNYEALLHFIRHGDADRRAPSNKFDPASYENAYPDVARTDLGPLQHYLRIGRFEGRKIFAGAQAAMPQYSGRPTLDWRFDTDAGEWEEEWRRLTGRLEAQAVSRRESAAITPIDVEEMAEADRRALAFPAVRDPVIDVIIPFYDEVELTRRCLESLRSTMGDIRVRPILVDDGSTEDSAPLGAIEGVTLLRNERNLHYLRSCNKAFRASSAPYVLLLNNDARLLPGALQALLAELEAGADVAATGPKIVYPSGYLQEAGCIIRADATTSLIGLAEDPALPCYNYARDVGQVSGACLLFRRALIDGDLYDERYVPAYCEDADLCLRFRAAGHRIRYVPDAVLVHELSVSTGKVSQARRVQLVVQNQEKLYDKWADFLDKENSLRAFAFYLPQFHPIEENDLWWGKGFTEWTNVSKAVPSFKGHYQPHLPADHGFYDLRYAGIMSQQMALARRYGVDGFIMYHYNFGARRVLDTPIRNLMADPSIDFRFALCWANENWTRHWDGGEKSILLEQKYDEETLRSVCDDAIAAAHDPRCITVNGRPMFLVYRPLLFPDVRVFTEMVRKAFRAEGLPDPYLMYVESMEAISRGVVPDAIGFDACVEFPPQGVGAPHKGNVEVLKTGWEGHVYDYEGSAALACLRPAPPFKRMPAVFPSWDNSARQPLKGTSFIGQTPALFAAYVREKALFAHDMLVGEEKMLFVNAWNEWAEGTHLEPDIAYGHSWLQALEDGVIAAKYPRSKY